MEFERVTVTGLPLGAVRITAGALSALLEAGDTPLPYLHRHASGDWGELSDEDRAANAEAVTQGERIVSAYSTPAGLLWIITEWDRSATTILLPDEY